MENRQSISLRGITQGGFTLIELMIVILVIIIMAVISAPSFIQWRQNLMYRDTGRDLVSILREARNDAISTNREHRVEFNINGGQYRLMRGNSSSNSTAWPVEIRPWALVNPGVILRQGSGLTCPSNANVNVEFNPNGTAVNPDGTVNDIRICIQDTAAANRNQVTINPTMGRVRMQ
ncbi:MAG: GspH/FimT family pseudopilin [Nitrospiria bacterium]